jgi:hypothetical protein
VRGSPLTFVAEIGKSLDHNSTELACPLGTYFTLCYSTIYLILIVKPPKDQVEAELIIYKA